MEYSSRKSVVAAIKSYTISRGVDYNVYEPEPLTFYVKCKTYGNGCNWLIRTSLIRKKGCWEIWRYNGRHTCTIGTISQDHSKLDSETVAEAIRPLVESDSSIKVKFKIAEVQSRFNYTISYQKAWLTKQKSIAKVFGGWKDSYQALPWWHSIVTQKMPDQLKYKGTPLVAVAQDGNQNIVPIAFVLLEGETTDAWHFFLRNLRRHVVKKDGVGMISDRHESIRAVVNRFGSNWQPPRACWMFCIRHIDSNFLRTFKIPHLQKLVVNIGYSRTVEEYNINYKRLEERGEAYARWCDAIGLRHWVLAFDEGHRWGHMTTNLVECINSVLKGA
ncbi:uncharacterized protein LOC107607822 [Arachis ipaensis]|uniref:uncharacterized protein LOC107607822 n=1 Tax=Arachis ipaensis TaxID=130454 RepID=UPI0007AF85E1|nr:uncharacterized protein LOC107607822 [Arachis ipaensis]XP_025665234.1 uncharacterized protein LOC112763904 [Arachis hypogaea]